MDTVKLVAVDMDGTFLARNHRYDVERFARIYARMREAGCRFVVASGNQYWQLRDAFTGFEGISYVAENGAYVTDGDEVVFVGRIGRPQVLDALAWLDAHPDILCVMSCEECAYIERGRASQWFFTIMQTYYHRLSWADDLAAVDDPVLKFALSVPEAMTYEYFDEIRDSISVALEPTTSGHGSIDLIVPGNHKASGIVRLCERWGIPRGECMAFGDGDNDIEMLRFVGHPYAMANASQAVMEAAGAVCPSNEEQGVLTVLEDLFR